MDYIKRIKKNGKVSLSEVESKRVDGKIIQRHIEYLGKEADGKTILSSSNSSIQKIKLYGSLLLDLPIDLDYAIANKAPYNEETKIMATLATTCKQLGFFRQELEKRASNQLGKYIEDADIVKVEAMVKANPRLLLHPIEKIVNPHTLQIIEGMKPLEAACCEGDYEMCRMLTKYFKLACRNKKVRIEEIHKQLNEKFAEGSDENMESEETRKNRLEKVLRAITNERFNHGRDAATNKWILSKATQIAIATYEEEFDASQPKIIKSGRRFRLELLDEVWEEYARAARRWEFDAKKCALFEDAVLTIILGYAAANDIQKFAQGLYYLQNLREEFKRSFKTRDGYNFYQLFRGGSTEFLLPRSCVDIVNGGYVAVWRPAGVRARDWLAHLMLSKNFKFKELRELMEPPPRAKMSRCVVC